MNDVDVDADAIQALLAPGGDVDRHTCHLAEVTYEISQELVPQPGRERAPIDATGRLKRSGSVRRGEGEATWEVEYSAPYAIYVEMGTRHMAPEPYLRPAMIQAVTRDE